MSTHETSMMEERLRAALSARAEQVQPEHLAPLAPVVPLRPRWQSPWVLLATAAVVMLILGVAFRGIGSDPRSDDLAPKPDEPQVTLPADVGRDWSKSPESTPARVDLDGDGTKEKVEFLAEEAEEHDGRVRLQTTLSSTGEEAWGVMQVASTNIGMTAEGVIDADDDGDEELVVFDPGVDPSGGFPVVFDLRDGLLVQAAPEDPDLLLRGQVQVPGSETEYYDLVRTFQYWIDDGSLFSGRSVESFARAGEFWTSPLEVELEAWEWRLGPDGVLRREAAGCRELMFEVRACDDDSSDRLPVVGPAATESFGMGEEFTWDDGYTLTARLEAGADPALVVEGSDARTINHSLEVRDPVVLTTRPTGVFGDGASFVVRSASDPGYLQVLYQRGDQLQALAPVGEVPLTDDETHRTWLTTDGSLVTVVAADDGSWRAWSWQMVSRSEMAAIPGGILCFDDATDPTTGRAC
ncbi:hypothetical protein [Nocardioides hwasunensis]|uniref:VCBS repeat-containing protein n=1 Tax=Nocardioides hwasunensis TaxID=397258 RepID=A0ABR8MPF8_9ACTN|nr:hypothetical protein [Nocardioides hwasunensis]MBD3915994.1 hypothetical protein [Nocardioides hwasunensis]